MEDIVRNSKIETLFIDNRVERHMKKKQKKKQLLHIRFFFKKHFVIELDLKTGSKA